MKNSTISQFRTAQQEPPRPPKELGRHGKVLWRSLQEEYAITDRGGLAYLVSVCRAEDDIQRMRAIVATDGDVVEDRFKQKQPHPLLAAIRGAEQVKRQALAGLRLDVEPLRDRPGRPG